MSTEFERCKIWEPRPETYLQKIISLRQIPTLNDKAIAKLQEDAKEKDLERRQEQFGEDHSVQNFLWEMYARWWLPCILLTFYLLVGAAVFDSRSFRWFYLSGLHITLFFLLVGSWGWVIWKRETLFPTDVRLWKVEPYRGEEFVAKHPFPGVADQLYDACVGSLLKLEIESHPASHFEFLVLSSTGDFEGRERYYVDVRERSVSP